MSLEPLNRIARRLKFNDNDLIFLLRTMLKEESHSGSDRGYLPNLKWIITRTYLETRGFLSFKLSKIKNEMK